RTPRRSSSNLCRILKIFLFQRYRARRALHSFLHDALPICRAWKPRVAPLSRSTPRDLARPLREHPVTNGSSMSRIDPKHHHRRRSEEHTSELQHVSISYAVFCLKKKKTGLDARSGSRQIVE